MKFSRLADRYARALGMAITDDAQLENAAAAMHAVSDLYISDAAFRHAVANPIVDRGQREKVLGMAAEACEAPDAVAKLFNVLLEHNRLPVLPEIALQFDQQVDERLHRVEVTAVTAVALEPDLEEQLVNSLHRFTGKTVRLKSEVDPGIVGGLIVRMWGVFFDFSLRTRFMRMKQKLLAEERSSNGY
jgi:F-type H+-transporting ATPase subunit delta